MQRESSVTRGSEDGNLRRDLLSFRFRYRGGNNVRSRRARVDEITYIRTQIPVLVGPRDPIPSISRKRGKSRADQLPSGYHRVGRGES